MGERCRYGFGTVVALDFEETVEKVEQSLRRRHFAVTSRVRMDDILNGANEAAFSRYLILGVCNPDYARTLFRADPDIGLMMPCKVVIYEQEQGGCRVMIKDPVWIMDLIENPIAIEASIMVKEKMEEVVDDLRQLAKPARMNLFRK